jgi:hypothetical protein
MRKRSTLAESDTRLREVFVRILKKKTSRVIYLGIRQWALSAML